MRKTIALLFTAGSLLGLGGCANMDRNTAATVGGAAVGGLVGNAVLGTPGALLGAGAGAYIGNEATDRDGRYDWRR